MAHRTLPYLMLASLLSTLACSEDKPPPPPPYSLDGFALPGETFFPEGIAVAADGTFFVGSLSNGQIVRLPAGKEVVEEFSPPGVVSTAVGLVVDEALGLLWACDASLRQGTPAIVGLALADGAVRVRHAFPAGAALCNDLALDAAGNLYATDSLSPRILRVAAGRKLQQGSAEAWATAPAWEVGQGQFGLNGIIVKGSDVYAAHTQNNALYRIPIAAGGAAGAVVRVRLDRVIDGPDGLEFAENGRLVFVEANLNHLSYFTLGEGDTGRTGPVLAYGMAGPTTFALFADSAWVVEGQLDKFFNPSSGSPSLPFRVRRVQFEDSFLKP